MIHTVLMRASWGHNLLDTSETPLIQRRKKGRLLEEWPIRRLIWMMNTLTQCFLPCSTWRKNSSGMPKTMNICKWSHSLWGSHYINTCIMVIMRIGKMSHEKHKFSFMQKMYFSRLFLKWFGVFVKLINWKSETSTTTTREIPPAKDRPYNPLK